MDSGENRSQPYLVLEYVDGVSLYRHLRRHGRLSAEETIGLTRQIAAGLQYLHDRPHFLSQRQKMIGEDRGTQRQEA